MTKPTDQACPTVPPYIVDIFRRSDGRITDEFGFNNARDAIAFMNYAPIEHGQEIVIHDGYGEWIASARVALWQGDRS